MIGGASFLCLNETFITAVIMLNENLYHGCSHCLNETFITAVLTA